jgi:hypothetical protein
VVQQGEEEGQDRRGVSGGKEERQHEEIQLGARESLFGIADAMVVTTCSCSIIATLS